MSGYGIKWNKFFRIFAPRDTISIAQSPGLASRITNYQPPPEERELLLDKNPEPDFEAIVKSETED